MGHKPTELERYQHWFTSSKGGMTTEHWTGEDTLGADIIETRSDAQKALYDWFEDADETGTKFIGSEFCQYMGTVCIVDGTLSIENWAASMFEWHQGGIAYHQEQVGRLHNYQAGR